MGTGSSKIGKGSKKRQDFDTAFAPNINSPRQIYNITDRDRRNLRKDWEGYSDQYGPPISATDEKDIYSSANNRYGYINSGNSFKINKALYDPANSGKTDAEIFRDKKDLATVTALDNAIRTHKTPQNGAFTRFCTEGAIKDIYGLTDNQMTLLKNVQRNPT